MPCESVDSVVTVPETLASVCVNVQVTIVVPGAIVVPLSPVLSFESTPVPLHLAGGGPSPAPHEIPSTARAVTMMIGRADFTKDSRSTTEDYRGSQKERVHRSGITPGTSGGRRT